MQSGAPASETHEGPATDRWPGRREVLVVPAAASAVRGSPGSEGQCAAEHAHRDVVAAEVVVEDVVADDVGDVGATDRGLDEGVAQERVALDAAVGLGRAAGDVAVRAVAAALAAVAVAAVARLVGGGERCGDHEAGGDADGDDAELLEHGNSWWCRGSRDGADRMSTTRHRDSYGSTRARRGCNVQ